MCGCLVPESTRRASKEDGGGTEYEGNGTE